MVIINHYSNILCTKKLHHNIILCPKCHKNRALFVHHIDKNRNNNFLSNLMLVCKSCHLLLHHPQNKRKYGFREHFKPLYKDIIFKSKLDIDTEQLIKIFKKQNKKEISIHKLSKLMFKEDSQKYRDKTTYLIRQIKKNKLYNISSPFLGCYIGGENENNKG